MPKRPPILKLRSLTKSFGNFNAVDGIDLDIAEGEFFTIVGPSGSGKTTLIRMLAGMEQADERRHHPARQAHQRSARQQAPDLHGVPVAGAVPASHRRREHRVPAQDQGRRSRRRARSARLPCSTSCACRRTTTARPCPTARAASASASRLARALAFDPEILFFDEPLVGHRLQTAQDAREGAEGHPPRDRQDLRLHHPSARRGDGDVGPHRRHARRASSSRSARRMRSIRRPRTSSSPNSWAT